jgi:hypothetical protein
MNRENLFFALFIMLTLPFALVALPFVIAGILIAVIGSAPIWIWYYTIFPVLVWFEEWFVRRGFYIDLRGKE